MVTLADVKRANPIWFGAGNKRVFGDVSYKVLHGKATGRPFLVRATNAWTDMFGQPKKLHYRINPINPTTLKIEMLYDDVFQSMADAKAFLEDE